MRLLTLELERYGPFTGRTISFSADANLHVVFGQNEAGKSSALAAITDLLFGIERQTRFNFLHDARELRIGGTVIANDGRSLAFRRRKGNKDTLVGMQDEAIGEDSLAPYLGKMTREVFCNAFGLDSDTLRRGAEDMLTNEGEIGASLFAAASGLRGLSELRRHLEDEATSIFASRASKDRKFYIALRRFEEAGRAIRGRELKAAYWKDLNEKIEKLSRRLEEIRELRGVKAVQRTRLLRNKRIAPLVQLIDDDLKRLDSLGTLPELPVDFCEGLANALDAVRKGSEAKQRAQDDEVKAVRNDAEVLVDEQVLARAGDVLRAMSDMGAFANGRRDLPRIQAEVDEYRRLLGESAVKLGMPDETAVEAAQPTAAAQALAEKMISEGHRLTDAVERNRTALRTEQTALSRLEQQRSSNGGSVDPQPLRLRWSQLAPSLRSLDKLAEAKHMVRAEEVNLREAAARLYPPVSDLDALARVPIPGAETLSRYDNDLARLEREVAHERDRLTAATAAVSDAEAKLRDLTSVRPVASPDVIAAKRQERDATWNEVRGALFGSLESLATDQRVDLVTRFERRSSEADLIADQAVSEADRVAAFAVQSLRLKEERAKEADATARIRSLEERRQEVLKSWGAAWQSAGIAPLLPTEMAHWRIILEGLLERREKLIGQRERLAELETAIRVIEPEVRVLAAEVGLRDADRPDIAAICDGIETRLKALTEAWDNSRDLETRIRDTQHRIDEFVEACKEGELGLEQWSQGWSAAATAIGLRSGATIDEARAALAVWNEVPKAIRERDNRARRVSGMQREVDAFERSVRDLVATIAPDLGTMPADAAVKILNDRVTAARAAESRKTETQRRLVEATRARRDTDSVLREAEARLGALSAELPAGCNPTELLDQLRLRNRVLELLSEHRKHLITQGDGHDEAHLRAELASFNVDEVQSRVQILLEEEQSLEREGQEVFAAHEQALRERDAAEQGMGAELAAQQRASAEAELIETSREWAVLKFGALLLSTLIDRRRANQNDPLMARAGALFATLTGGSFEGLGQDYDDHDNATLIGRRSSGPVVPLTGMSTGARDQLYLALRLAYLEDYASRAEPPPFIGDDLFATFDEDRTAHGLAALAAIGRRVQPIVFTHHQHVADIAREKVGAEVLSLS
jgi:uncharacterized protein YhaN